MKFTKRWLVLNLATLILTAAASDSQAQSVAYRAHGTGRYVPNSPLAGEYDGRGVGGPLGRHNLFGDVVTSYTADPLVLDFYVPCQQTIGANGDTLLFSGTGRVTLIPIDATTFTAVWEGDFVVEGGTGRFARAKPANEPLHIVAVNDPFNPLDPEWPFSWTLTGRIVLR